MEQAQPRCSRSFWDRRGVAEITFLLLVTLVSAVFALTL
jgi:hypothetical protein